MSVTTVTTKWPVTMKAGGRGGEQRRVGGQGCECARAANSGGRVEGAVSAAGWRAGGWGGEQRRATTHDFACWASSSFIKKLKIGPAFSSGHCIDSIFQNVTLTAKGCNNIFSGFQL